MRSTRSIPSVLGLALSCLADNPIVQTYYTPDPAPMVWKDTLFVYTGHDEDVTVNNFFTMNDWRVYSTTDMVNWTDRGSPLSHKTFNWSGGKAWAAQCIPRDGKFYWYVTAGKGTGSQPAIGVAVSDNPTGPFKDPLGKPLVSQSWDDIDPTVFIDDDGQAYLFWGNPKLYWVKLNKDMTSYSGGVNVTNMTTAQFGTRTKDNAERKTTYEEGPWIFKRKGLYYMVYAAGPLPEPIGYSTSNKPTGPWTYRGEIMSGANTGSFTNHPGIIEYKGKGYFFYHTGKLPGGGGYKRSTAVEEFSFNADGTIPRIGMSDKGPNPVDSLNPFQRVEGETMAFSSGLKTQGNDQSGVYVTSIHNNDWIKLRAVDFGAGGAKSVEASVASAGQGGTIELRLGSQTGRSVGTISVGNTGGATSWKSVTTTVSGATGVQDLYLVFKGSGTGELFNLDWWRFAPNQTESVHPARQAKDPESLVDVYTASGTRLRSNRRREDALRGLDRGVYLVDGKPVAVLGR
ncbi:MAG TPA: glycoside hydrolase family 43 protein [Fibrobacteria bacterium]|nr:glycoside hydrolase family 43 protein [Fibrobacteria bacterium]